MLPLNSILLEAREVSIAYGAIIALEDISLTLATGEIIALVGASGSGKSTFIHAILGLLPENARIIKGDFLFEEKSLLKMPAKKKRTLLGSQISMLFQQPGNYLNPTRTIGKQYRDFLLTHGIEKKIWQTRAENSLKNAGLLNAEDILQKFPSQLSGGMRQKVAFAMTLELQPKLLLVDEPTSALDSLATYKLLQKLKEEARNSTSIIIVTHDIRAALYLGDKIIVLQKGKLIASGTKTEILNLNDIPYVDELIKSTPKLL